MSDELARYNVLFELISKKSGDGIQQAKQELTGLQKVMQVASGTFAGLFAKDTFDRIVGTVRQVGQRLFEVTAKYQKYNTVLSVALKSEREAAKAMQMVEETASSTIFSVDELTAAYIQMVNRGFKPTKDEIMAIADLAASQGRSFQDLTQAMLNATTGEYEMLKGFGIKVTTVGDKLSLNFKGINKEIGKTPEEMQAAILAFGKMEGVTGSNIKQMEQLGGVVSNIGDSSEKLARNLGDRLKGAFTGVLNVVKSVVEKFVEWTSIPLSDQLEKERVELNLLVSQITDANTSQETRNKLIGTLQSQYPDFLKNIDAESASNDVLKKRLQEVNNQYIYRIVLQKRSEKEQKIAEKLGDLQLKKEEKYQKLREDIFKLDEKYGTEFISKKNIVGGKNFPVIDPNIDLEKAIENVKKYQKLYKGYKINVNEIGDILFQVADINRTGTQEYYRDQIDEYQKYLDDFQAETARIKNSLIKSLGIVESDLPSTNQTNKPTITTKATGKDDKAAKAALEAAKQRLQNEFDLWELYAKMNYDSQVDYANQTISNKGKLDLELQKLELEHQLVMLSIQRNTLLKTQKLTGESQKIKIEQLDYESQKLNQIYDGLIKMESIEILGKAKDPLSNIRQEIEAITGALELMRKQGKVSDETGVLVEVINDVLFGDGKTAEKAQNELIDRVNSMMEKTLKASEDFYSSKKDKDLGTPLQQLLGLDDKELKALDDSLTAMGKFKDAMIDIYDSEIEKIDQVIDKQSERVAKAEQMAEKGNVKQLKLEEERLSKLAEQREKYAQQQRIIAQLNITTAQAESAANSILIITEAFKQGAGPAAIISGIATGVALAAQIAAIGFSLNNAFNSLPSYYEGVERTGRGKIDSKNGFLMVGHPDERWVPASVNKKIGYDFPNSKLADAVDLYKQFPKLKHEIKGSHVSDEKKFKSLEGKIDELKASIESININTKLDRNGFVQEIERDFDRVTRRKKIMG